MQDPVADLITTYHELNATVIDELHEEPSALEFMRYVAKNRPFVVRGGAKSWKACESWDAAYLSDVMRSEDVQVAVTPYGNADGVVELDNGTQLFVEPHQTKENFVDFLQYVQQDSALPVPSPPEIRNVKYAQTQNDNLRAEYRTLFADVPPNIPWARIALAQSADAINFWLGNARSTTALHRDNYENIYTQVVGQKHFVLLPPIEQPCVNEIELAQYHYTPSTSTSTPTSTPTPTSSPTTATTTTTHSLSIRPQPSTSPIPVAVYDPSAPSRHQTKYSKLSRPLRVTLEAGDMLYLPAQWYHKVSQSSGPEGFACAVNYWYDMDFEGQFWASNAFVRDVVAREAGRVRYPDFEMGRGE